MVNHTKRNHAKLSASGSSRWINCAGSIEAEAQVKNKLKKDSTIFADEGTCCHELSDICLRNNKDALDYLPNLIKGKIYVNDNYGSVKNFLKELDYTGSVETYFKGMCSHAQEYIDYVRSHIKDDCEIFFEQRVDFSNVVPEGFGTLDAAVFDLETKICHIFDLKYGKTIVEAFENSQGQLYAVGLLNELGFMYDIKSFRIHICQPRRSNWPHWDISLKDLKIFMKKVKERAALALSKNPPRTPGEKQCEWCLAKDDCLELMKFSEQIITAEFDDLEGRDPKEEFTLSDHQMRLIVDNKSLITKFMEAVEKRVYERVNTPEGFPGYKLIKGSANRQWAEDAETKLEAELGDKAYNKKLIGLGDAEKLTSKEFVDKITFKPEGKPKMVPDTHKGKAIVIEDIADGFEELD